MRKTFPLNPRKNNQTLLLFNFDPLHVTADNANRITSQYKGSAVCLSEKEIVEWLSDEIISLFCVCSEILLVEQPKVAHWESILYSRFTQPITLGACNFLDSDTPMNREQVILQWQNFSGYQDHFANLSARSTCVIIHTRNSHYFVILVLNPHLLRKPNEMGEKPCFVVFDFMRGNSNPSAKEQACVINIKR